MMTMTRYYLFIVAGRDLDGSARAYKVAISQTIQGRRDFAYLSGLSESSGYFFAPWSMEVAEFWERIQGSCREIPDYSFISARCLVRSLKAGVSVPDTGVTSLSSHHQRMALDSDYRVSVLLSKSRHRSFSACGNHVKNLNTNL